ncbi:putative hemolysin [Burkholderia multivorans]|uniref:putative hemolysin n=1 Tax=Burkholderia multivorans TaxID=87883 RepID=UPI0020B453B1|nr:DUF333 domain-containing protein [Burkholderia multivorans]MCA8480113.1 DUF333 domain-containing protein [Burkholderia multivorans]
MKLVANMVTLIFAGVPVMGCSNADTSQPAIGMANPASTHCVSKGGQLVIQKDKDGNEIGICHLPDGTQIEEWKLFRRDHPQSGL